MEVAHLGEVLQAAHVANGFRTLSASVRDTEPFCLQAPLEAPRKQYFRS